MWITSMGNHGVAGVSQNAGVLVVLVLAHMYIPWLQGFRKKSLCRRLKEQNSRLALAFCQKFTIETVSPEGTFCDTVQVPSRGGDMELI